MLVQRDPEALWQRVMDGAIVLLRDGSLLDLNQTASVVWDALDEPADVVEVAAHIARQLGLEQRTIQPDVAAVIESFRRAGVVIECR